MPLGVGDLGAALLAGAVAINPLAFLFAGEPLTLSVLIDEAKRNSPEILAAKKRWQASQARIPQAKSLEDPAIGLGFQYTPGSPFQLAKTPSQERMLSLQQFLPFFGKLSLKGKIALVESQMAAAVYKNAELEVVNQVKNAYYDLFMNYKEINLNQQSLALLENIAAALSVLPPNQVRKIVLKSSISPAIKVQL